MFSVRSYRRVARSCWPSRAARAGSGESAIYLGARALRTRRASRGSARSRRRAGARPRSGTWARAAAPRRARRGPRPRARASPARRAPRRGPRARPRTSGRADRRPVRVRRGVVPPLGVERRAERPVRARVRGVEREAAPLASADLAKSRAASSASPCACRPSASLASAAGFPAESPSKPLIARRAAQSRMRASTSLAAMRSRFGSVVAHRKCGPQSRR